LFFTECFGYRYYDEGANLMSSVEKEIFSDLEKAIVEGDEKAAKGLAEEGLKKGLDPNDLIMKSCLKGMEIVGDKYKRREYFIPEVLLSAGAMTDAVDTLKPHVKLEKGSTGVVVIGTVEGDVHDIGKNIVKIMLQAGGFKVIDLGRAVIMKNFVEKAKETNANVIAMTALMSTTAPMMRKAIDMLKEEGIREKFKVMIGGASTTEDFAKEIGADAWGKDAMVAVEIARKFCQSS
jgi:dimethylamine corrinoid protein